MAEFPIQWHESLNDPPMIIFLGGLLALGVVSGRLGLSRASNVGLRHVQIRDQMLTARFDVPAESVNDAKRALSTVATQFGGKLLDAYSVDELVSQFCTGTSDGTDLMMDNQGLNNPLPAPKLVKQA